MLGHDGLVLAGIFGRFVKGGTPFGKGGACGGDRAQPHPGQVVLHRKCRRGKHIAELVLHIVQRHQLLAHVGAVLEVEGTHAAHRVGGAAILDLTARNAGVPARQAVEITHRAPDLFDGCGNDGAGIGFGHGFVSLSLLW
jgi:hypothetical protein